MKHKLLALLSVGLFAFLAGCGEEEPQGPPKSEIYIDNQSSTEASVRIKFWTKEYTAVSAGDSATIAFENPDKMNIVQVEAKTRKQWDDCWVTLNVGETLVVFDATERIGCRVD